MSAEAHPYYYAFPIAPGDVPYWQPGMSLRDFFAANALPQAIEDYGEPIIHGNGSKQRRDRGNLILPYATKESGTREKIIARQAYKYADAMMAARAHEKESNP